MKRLAALALSGILVACGSDGPTVPPPDAVTITLSGGNSQNVPLGQAAPQPLVATLTDSSGAPVAGVAVTWSVMSGGGSVAGEPVTDASGQTHATYTAGTTSGLKRVKVSVDGAPSPGFFAVFVLQALPGPAKRLVKVSGDLQSTGPSTPLLQPLTVQVVDSFGNGVIGTAVSWAVTSGGGSASPNPSLSDSSGLAATVYTTGSSPGTASVTAASGTLVGSPVSFSATVTIGIVLVKEIPVPANYGQHDQFVRAGLAFLCSWNTGLQIYDVGDGRAGGSLANPMPISAIVTTGGQVHNAWWYWAPNGDKRYVFVGQEGPAGLFNSSSGDIHVVDISNLNAPVEVASYRLAGAGTHNFWIDEVNQVLYAAYYNGGVVALDISGTLPANLATREIARIQPGGAGNTFIWGVQLYNGSVYATDMLSGFWQLKLVGNTFQAFGGNNVPERYGSDQWVANGYAYSGTWGNRAGRSGNALKIWQLNATGLPVLLDSIVTTGIGTVSDVEVSADGRMLMFSAENGSGSGIYFYSLVGNPGQPTFIGRYLVSSGVHTASFYESGGRRYVFAAKDPGSPSMLILDVTAINP